jgi:hypothetical protein
MKLAFGWRAFAIAFVAAPAAAYAYDEAVSPDLSNNPSAPTPLAFVVGNNQVRGTVRNTAPSDTRDYVTFTIAAGQQLTAIHMLSYTNVAGGGSGNTGFHAINLGATSQAPDPGGANENFYLGGDHAFSVSPTDNVLLDLADGSPAGTGFSTPLGPGTYSYLMQQVSGAVVYDLQFVVSGPAASAVPASNPWLGVLLAGLVAMAGLGSIGFRQVRQASGRSTPTRW